MRLIGAILFAWFSGLACAQAQVVALGDSATRGYVLPIEQAWPAKLEGLLRQHGQNLAVANEGVNGDTSDGMLSRMASAVPSGTRVVILMCCGNDNKDKRHIVADHEGNIRDLVSKLRARGVAVVYSGSGVAGLSHHDDAGAAAARSAGASWCGWSYQGLAPDEIQDDGKAGHHPTPQGHDKIAARMLPCVLRALSRKG